MKVFYESMNARSFLSRCNDVGSTSSNYLLSIKRYVMLCIGLVCVLGMQAQTFNYGTGSITANAAPFASGNVQVSVSGNSVTVTGNTTIAAGTYNFANFTINPGVTLTVTGTGAPLIIRCTGTFTNNGILSANGGNGNNGNSSGQAAGGVGVAGGANGGSGGGATLNSTQTAQAGGSFGSSAGGGKAPCNGNSGIPYSTTNGQYGAVGGSGGGYSVVGSQGGTQYSGGMGAGCSTRGNVGAVYGNATLTLQAGAAASFQSIGLIPESHRWLLGGSGGAGGGGCSAGGGGGGGGAGGGSIQIVANDIVIGSAGIIRARGGNGGRGYDSGNCGAGSGGAGSGGTIHLVRLNSFTNNNTNTTESIDVRGGTGGSSTSSFMGDGGSGGAGGAGRSLIDQDILLCTAVTIASNPQSASLCSGGNASFTATASGDDPITYQWQSSTDGVNWNNIIDGGVYSNAQTTTLNITGAHLGLNGAQYRLAVTNDCGEDESSAATLTVNYCGAPPVNDNPSNTNPNLSHPNAVYPTCSQVTGSTAGATLNSNTGTRDVWYRLTAISNGVSIRVSSSVIDAVLYLFEDNNMSAPIAVENAVTGTGLEVLNFDELVEGNLYRLAVASASAVDGDFTICIQQLRKPQCTANTNVSLCELIQTTVTGAHNIAYQFTDVNTNAITTYVGTGNSMLASAASAALRYGSTYTVQYTANYYLQNGLGEAETIIVPNTQTCSITIGAHRAVVVKTNNRCSNGATLARSAYLSGEFVGAGGMCNITGFEYEFTPVANCAGDDPQVLDKFSKTISSATPYMSLTYAFNHMPLAQNPNLGYWSVKMRPRFSGYSGTYGAAYVVAVNGTSPAAASMAINNTPVANAVMPTMGEMDANIYPNPNSGDLVNLNITGINSNEVYVRIMDSMGREVYTNRYAVDGSLNTMVSFSKSLSQGIYMVEMRAGDVVKTQRMVVTK
jgi:hypothetical protein